MNSHTPHNPDPSSVAKPLGDPLGEILHLLKLTGTFYCQSELSAPWGFDIPEFKGVMAFVVVTEGRCWLEMVGEAPMLVEKGDLVLLTCGLKHRLLSEPGTASVDLSTLPVRKVTEAYETLRYGGGGELTRVMYGIVRFDHAAGQRLVDLLPNVLKIDTWSGHSSDWLQSTLQFISREARELRPGGETVITRLADIVVIEAIRNWINTAPEARVGWLEGVRDDQIGRAIMAIHRRPAQDWSVENLAQISGMSRSAFSARFTRLVGQSAMQYLTTWRMHLARTKLLETSQPVARIADSLGYQSEPAFSRAFKRVFNVPPGRFRQHQKAAKQDMDVVRDYGI
ncbi:AraC family transcriptional regulator [Sulfitobacter mediterraneus]|uniref:AraC family transcriptional regulator n=1 Tax=Sulfitobacter mediterraneus TaxID=83219 RepID=A0A061SUI0_9RHOB|nr:AraC family transcriptional regulator [Sulfitobacter mediterraneus]KAJ02980.1 AraC family transcriptional regulator [Sulfitobacter mediterraneus]